MKLTLREIAELVSGQTDEALGVPVAGYSIDSRTIRPGQLFFAIRGPHFDGHDFLSEVACQGAAGAVVSSVEAKALLPSGLPSILVDSTTEALQTLARAVRRKWGGRVIAVTGSAGKTTTKEMVAMLLEKNFCVLRSEGNLNNEYGLPLSLLRVGPQHDVAVLEMGMSAKGEILKLSGIAEPSDGVIVNVNPVHLEFFDSVEDIAEAKAELLAGLVGDRRAYLNNDDVRVRAMADGFDGEVVTYGARPDSTFCLKQIEDRGLEGSRFTVMHGEREVGFELPLLGRHNVSNAVAAISVGITHGVDWDDARRAVQDMAAVRMRGKIHKFREGFTVIDDCYNSNPEALKEMIRIAGKLSGFERRILVAGEMLELGEDSRRLHRACGREAVHAGMDRIIAVRGDAEALLEGAEEAGADPVGLLLTQDAAEAGDRLAQIVCVGDLVLMKGSRGVHLEQVIEILNQRFEVLES
jgi:UDP-N-acetylmuramoyl-tripeptide--D-alanyl-D-alanine ligase